MNKLPIPVIWNFDYDTVIGNATTNDDGSVTITILDQTLVEIIKGDQERILKGLTISPTPSKPKDK